MLQVGKEFNLISLVVVLLLAQQAIVSVLAQQRDYLWGLSEAEVRQATRAIQVNRPGRFSRADAVTNDEELNRAIDRIAAEEKNSIKQDALNYVEENATLEEILKMIKIQESTERREVKPDLETALPSHQQDDELYDSDVCCSICLTKVHPSEAQKLRCGHPIHEYCAEKWSINDKTNCENRLRKVKCPVCRQASDL